MEKMKGICLLSGGIDSAVSAYLLSRKAKLTLLNLNINPKKARRAEKVRKIAKKLGLGLYSAPYKRVQEKIANTVEDSYICVVCKRTMLRVAEEFCKEEGGDFILTGEELGQVASQTLKNLRVLDSAVNLPVLRPLLGWNKEEIIRKAKEIGTYSLSIVHPFSCGVTPARPATSANLAKVREEEKKLDLEKIVKSVKEEIEKVSWKR